MICRQILCYLGHDESHKCCVSHCDENIHFESSFFIDFYLHDLAVFLSDNNIPHPRINEKLMVIMIDINFLNI